MLIDWFTVVAQVLNFLILVWLLKHFLYHPILKAIDVREKRIADELADADAKRAEAEQKCELFEKKNAEFDRQRIESMNKVSEDAKNESARLFDLARQESDTLRYKLALSLKNEQLSLQDELNSKVQKEIFDIVRKALSDLAGTSLEGCMAVTFVQRLDALQDAEKSHFQAAFKHSDQPIIVHSAFDLPDEPSALIVRALKGLLGDSVIIQFVTEPELISGIEMNANGQKVAWSIADYLTTLTKRVDEVMQSHGESHDNTQANDIGMVKDLNEEHSSDEKHL